MLEIALRVPGVVHGVNFVGFSGATFTNAPNSGAIFLMLDSFEKRAADPHQSAPAIQAELNRRLSKIQEAPDPRRAPPPVRGIGNAGGFRMMVEDRGGHGPAELREAAAALMGRAGQTPGLAQVFTLFETSTPQLYLDIDRTKAQLLGVNVPDVFDALQIYLGSAYVNDFNLFGRTFRVMAQARDEYRRDIADVLKIRVRNSDGDTVPLGSFTTVRDISGPYRVPRYNLYPAAELDGAAAPGYSQGQAIEIMEKLAAETLPEGFGYEWTTLAFQQIRAGNTAVFAFVLAVVFVFLVLAAQYESLTLPLAVILIVPMCLVASITGVILRGQDNNILTQVGFVVLIGLAAKNAILIVEFARQLEDAGPRPLGGRRRGGAAAAAADPDDLVRLHPRRDAAGLGDRRRRRTAPDARHRGVLRHDRRHGVRPHLHAGVLRHRPLDRPARAATRQEPPSAGAAGGVARLRMAITSVNSTASSIIVGATIRSDRHASIEIRRRTIGHAQGGRCAAARRAAVMSPISRRRGRCMRWCCARRTRMRAFDIDVAKARAMPGVRLVLTGAETAELGLLPCPVGLPDTKFDVPPYPILARDEVRHVGDAVAFVVADTLERAKDAAEAIAIDWEPLPHVIGVGEALKPGAPLVWPGQTDNIVFEIADRRQGGDRARFRRRGENRFADARQSASGDQLSRYPRRRRRMRRRGRPPHPDAVEPGPHVIRDMLAAILRRAGGEAAGHHARCRRRLRHQALSLPRICAGGGRRAAPARAGEMDRRPHRAFPRRRAGPRQPHHGAARARRRHRFLALDVDLVADMGAYLSCYAPFIPYLGAGMSPGVYDIPACHVRVRGVYTNTVPVDAYRGAGRPEAAYVIERLVDVAAREIGIAPDALRRRNFIKPKAMPYQTATGKSYDSGDFAAHMQRAQDIADWAGFRARLAQSKKAGRLRGIGLATYIEACGNNGPETAIVRLERDGVVTVLIGSQSTGQGHATAYAQLVAEHLDMPPERVTVVQGDTDLYRHRRRHRRLELDLLRRRFARRRRQGSLPTISRRSPATRSKPAPAISKSPTSAVRIAGTDRAISFADAGAAAGRARAA